MTTGHMLVTGAAGFLGSAIVQQAVCEGLAVTATDRTAGLNIPGADFVAADILDASSLTKVCEGADCVCHVAGLAHVFNAADISRAPFYRVNVEGTQNVAQAALRSGVSHFVFISSVSVYGGTAQGSNEKASCNPEGPYADSKMQAEQWLIELCQKERMNLTILRLATLYGEEDPGNVARLVHAIAQGKFLWVGKGENLKSLLYRGDAARACMAVIRNPLSGIYVYNVSAPCRPMKDIVDAIACVLGKDVPSWHVPSSVVLPMANALKYLSLNHGRIAAFCSTLQKWLADDYYSTDKFCKTYQYQTNVSLEEGIRREVAWYKEGALVKSQERRPKR